MPLSRLPLPSLSVVLTSSSLDGPVELFNMTDSGHALRREIHLNTQPKDDDPLMKTLDTRFAGSFAYSATYTTDKGATATAHVHHASAASAGSPSSSSDDSDDGGPDVYEWGG
ncbi:hypothetical protein NMY22_g14635 [Coprinellus aureogranulatus]|nr:hypothetical protein NMY22_g14635 [Coprinellus aureogranulatus]